MRGVYFFILAGLVFVALGIFIERNEQYKPVQSNNVDAAPSTAQIKPPNNNSPSNNPLQPKYSSSASGKSSGSVILKADQLGHFRPKVKLNNHTFEVLVDTGASTVAINRSTANRIGLNLKPSDFTHIVSTANGRVKAASKIIKSISIGNIQVSNVRALVLEDKSLDTVLLGMSFLGKLEKFEIEANKLTLHH